MNEIPDIIYGASHTDSRGMVSFFNDFQLNNIKRFYLIENKNTETVRAWQGHKNEKKWFTVVSGRFIMVLVRPDDWNKPCTNLEIIEFDLSVNKTEVLYVPGGYATGFKAIEPLSKIAIFSDFTLDESVNDDYRFDQNLWYDWNKI